MANKLVSVIIPTRNSAKFLSVCIHSIRNQTYESIEIIVSDNYSTDSSLAIAMGYKLPVVLLPFSERSPQTNAGAKIAIGEYICRIDSDFVLEPDLIEKAVKEIEKGYDAVKIFGTSDDTISLWAKVRRIERDAYHGDWMHTAPCFFRKEAFWAVGGFNERLSAEEEFDLQEKLLRAGFKISAIDAKAYHLGEPTHLSDVVKSYIFYGKMMKDFLEENPGKGAWQVAPFRMVLLRHIKEFLSSPKIAFAFLLYYYVKYLSALLGYLTVVL